MSVFTTKKRKGWKYTRQRVRLAAWWLWHRATSSLRVMPNFLIVGAMKGGTTSLFNYLAQHPQVYPPFRKEIKFFDCNYVNGLSWYRAHFPLKAKFNADYAVTGEATPYYIFHPVAPQRIAQDLPNAKIIILLRNPVDRAYSHYQHMVRARHEKLSFEDAIHEEEKRLDGEAEKISRDPNYPTSRHIYYSYASRGRYAEQLETWFNLFPREQFLILDSKELSANTSTAYLQTLEFLGLPAWEPQDFRNLKVGSYEALEPKIRQELADYFRPFNAQLYDLLDRKFDWDK
jgi:hypothetical protein